MKRTALAFALAALPFAALAHKAWLQPSQTVIAGENPVVTVDAAVSNDLFYFNHVPLKLDNLAIVAPDGSAQAPTNPARLVDNGEWLNAMSAMEAQHSVGVRAPELAVTLARPGTDPEPALILASLLNHDASFNCMTSASSSRSYTEERITVSRSTSRE